MMFNPHKVLFTKLDLFHFKFNVINDKNVDKAISNIMKCLDQCGKVDVKGKWFRARKIENNDENIKWKNGIPISGYPAILSGVAPAQYIKKCGRANNKYEQVLYVAENKETTLKEIKLKDNEYASVASCNFNDNVTVFDFSPYSNDELEKYVKEQFSDAEIISPAYMFIELQRILTLPEYNENEYKISRYLVKVTKEKYDVSGIMYISSFTGKKNLAIWDENKDVVFSKGVVFQMNN